MLKKYRNDLIRMAENPRTQEQFQDLLVTHKIRDSAAAELEEHVRAGHGDFPTRKSFFDGGKSRSSSKKKRRRRTRRQR